jgi:hypothetical protein
MAASVVPAPIDSGAVPEVVLPIEIDPITVLQRLTADGAVIDGRLNSSIENGLLASLHVLPFLAILTYLPYERREIAIGCFLHVAPA